MSIPYPVFIAVLPLLAFAWAVYDPLAAIKVIARLHRKLRDLLVFIHGRHYAQLWAERVREDARQKDYPMEVIERLIEKQMDETVRELGTSVYEKYHKPSFLENFYDR